MNTKIGLITLTIPQEISPIPEKSLNIMEQFLKRAEESLSRHDLEVFRIPELVNNSEIAEEQMKYLIDKKVHCIIIMIGAWPSPALAVDMIGMLNRRVLVVLWAFPDDTILSLVPACQFHGAFDDMEIKHEFIYNEPEDAKFIEKIRTIANASRVVNELNGMNFGLFGGRYMHMYTGTVDPLQVKKVFGVEITHINEFCLMDEAKKVEEHRVKEFSISLHDKYGDISAPADIEDRAIRLYFVMKKLSKDHKLDFAGVKCMLEVQGSYCSHCLSVATNINEGFIVSCEADVNGALTMQILHLLSNAESGFGDVFAIDIDRKILRLANCGTMATNFARNPKEVVFNEQYPLVPGGTGIIPTFVCKPGKVTLARLGRKKGWYVMQISSGSAFTPSKDQLTKGWEKLPHILINMVGDPENFIQNTRSNHMHWVYGEYGEELKRICEILNIDYVVC